MKKNRIIFWFSFNYFQADDFYFHSFYEVRLKDNFFRFKFLHAQKYKAKLNIIYVHPLNNIN